MKSKFKENIDGYLFILPWFIGCIIFSLGPIVISGFISLTKYEIITPMEFIGFDNYVKLIKDELFWKSLFNTLYYVGLSVPLRIILALLLAILLNQKVKGITFFRTAFYMPTMTAGVALALLWSWIFEPEFGVLNTILAKIGINGPSWLGSTRWAMPALVIMSLWHVGGPMIIFLAGLQSVPQQLYEAVEIDGGGSWDKFKTITIPMISPVIFFNLIMEIINSFQIFTNAYIMTGGGPANATLVYVLYLYNNAFQWLHMGYASALAWVFFIIIFSLVLLQMKLSSSWVYYEGRRV